MASLKLSENESKAFDSIEVDVFVNLGEGDSYVANFFKRDGDWDDHGFPTSTHIGFIKITPETENKIFKCFCEKYPEELL